jgi:hypothetical protein
VDQTLSVAGLASRAVTLRLAARDATGATVTETILAAYRTSG